MVYEYKWKGTVFPVPAQQAGEYMHDISEREGGLTAERLLELSRDEDALMHKCFEWDDTKAAEKYRLSQAGYMIRTIVATKINNEPVQNQRAFVSVTQTAHAEKGIFKPIITALAVEKDRAVVLENAMRDWGVFKEKYSKLDELAKAIEAFDAEVAV